VRKVSDLPVASQKNLGAKPPEWLPRLGRSETFRTPDGQAALLLEPLFWSAMRTTESFLGRAAATALVASDN